MRRITKTAGTSLISLLILLSFAPITFAASEVKGTLSSDGSSGTAQHPGNAGGTTSAGQTLSGTVMGGTESNGEAMTALAGLAGNKGMLMLFSVLIPLTLLLAGAGFLVYRRGV